MGPTVSGTRGRGAKSWAQSPKPQESDWNRPHRSRIRTKDGATGINLPAETSCIRSERTRPRPQRPADTYAKDRVGPEQRHPPNMHTYTMDMPNNSTPPLQLGTTTTYIAAAHATHIKAAPSRQSPCWEHRRSLHCTLPHLHPHRCHYSGIGIIVRIV